jgi:hypothetical protein
MAKANAISIPYLDPNVQHVGISRLRALSATQLPVSEVISIHRCSITKITVSRRWYPQRTEARTKSQ